LKRWKDNQKIFNENYKNKFSLGYHFFSIDEKNILNKIKDRYLEIIEDPLYSYIFDEDGNISDSHNGVFFMLKNPVNSIPEILNLISKKIESIVNQYYGCHFLITHIAAYRTKNITNHADKEVYAHKLHCDRHKINILKMFVALQDISSEDGPFTFFDKEYSKKVTKAGYKERDKCGNAQVLINDKDKQKFFVGDFASAVICDTASCLHKAGIPLVGRKRDLLIFSFESSPVPVDLKLEENKKKIEKKIEEEYMYLEKKKKS
jgi:hypothetical protein